MSLFRGTALSPELLQLFVSNFWRFLPLSSLHFPGFKPVLFRQLCLRYFFILSSRCCHLTPKKHSLTPVNLSLLNLFFLFLFSSLNWISPWVSRDLCCFARCSFLYSDAIFVHSLFCLFKVFCCFSFWFQLISFSSCFFSFWLIYPNPVLSSMKIMILLSDVLLKLFTHFENLQNMDDAKKCETPLPARAFWRML